MNSLILCERDINTKELNKFHLKYSANFKTKTRTLEKQAFQYLEGKFLEKGRGNMKCGVPDDIVFKTKGQLGLEMLLEAQNRKVPFAWVGMDCFYGEQPWLLDEIDSKDMVYIADIPCDTQIWLEKPGVSQTIGFFSI